MNHKGGREDEQYWNGSRMDERRQDSRGRYLVYMDICIGYALRVENLMEIKLPLQIIIAYLALIRVLEVCHE